MGFFTRIFAKTTTAPPVSGGVIACALVAIASGATQAATDVNCADWDDPRFFRDMAIGDVEKCLEAGPNLESGEPDGSTSLRHADISSATDNLGRTPLHLAIEFLAPHAVVELLVRHGVNIAARDKHGRTPLHTAAFRSEGGLRIVDLLIEQGALIGELDRYHRSSLHHAARSGACETVKRLVDLGENINHREVVFGHTPVDTARLWGNKCAYDLLTARGARETSSEYLMEYATRSHDMLEEHVRTLCRDAGTTSGGEEGNYRGKRIGPSEIHLMPNLLQHNGRTQEECAIVIRQPGYLDLLSDDDLWEKYDIWAESGEDHYFEGEYVDVDYENLGEERYRVSHWENGSEVSHMECSQPISVRCVDDSRRQGFWNIFAADGSHQSGEYVDGLKEGGWQIEYPSGEWMISGEKFEFEFEASERGNMRAGKRSGEWRLIVPYPVEINYDDLVEGLIEDVQPEFNCDACVQEAVGAYVDGRRSGEWSYFYGSGASESGNYTFGERYGMWRLHRPDGSVREKGEYVADKRHGLWEIFDIVADTQYDRSTLFDGEALYVRGERISFSMSSPSEIIASGGKLGLSDDGHDMVAEGIWKFEYPSGKIERGPLVGGVRNGDWMISWPRDLAKERGRYFEGRRHGEWELEWANGRVEIGRFNSVGHREGEWRMENRAELVVQQGEYRDGRPIGEWEHNYPNGLQITATHGEAGIVRYRLDIRGVELISSETAAEEIYVYGEICRFTGLAGLIGGRCSTRFHRIDQYGESDTIGIKNAIRTNNLSFEGVFQYREGRRLRIDTRRNVTDEMNMLIFDDERAMYLPLTLSREMTGFYTEGKVYPGTQRRKGELLFRTEIIPVGNWQIHCGFAVSEGQFRDGQKTGVWQKSFAGAVSFGIHAITEAGARHDISENHFLERTRHGIFACLSPPYSYSIVDDTYRREWCAGYFEDSRPVGEWQCWKIDGRTRTWRP